MTAITAVPATSRSAYTIGSMITFFAESSSDWADVMVHESAHAQDQGFSDSAGYLNAIGSDSCVPDDYAQTNNVECYAQDMVVFLYKLWRPYAPPAGTDCMSHQLQALNSSQAAGLQAYINSTGQTFALTANLADPLLFAVVCIPSSEHWSEVTASGNVVVALLYTDVRSIV